MGAQLGGWGKLPTARQSYLLSGMHPTTAYMHPKLSIDLHPTSAYFAPNRAIDMHPRGIDFAPTSSRIHAPSYDFSIF